MKLYDLKYILLLYGFCACSENEYQQSQNLPESPYETVGRLHNEGLDYVFDELVKSRTLTRSEGKPEIEPCEILELCSDFVKENVYSDFKRVTTKSDNYDMDHQKLQFDFSERQNYYVERLKKILECAKPGFVEDVVKNIEKLEHEMLNDEELPKNECEPLLYGMVTCKYSARYWVENYERWMIELKGVDVSIGVLTKTNSEYTVSPSWWDKYGHIVAADGWWAMQGFLQSGVTGIPWYIIGMTVGQGIAGSVLVHL